MQPAALRAMVGCLLLSLITGALFALLPLSQPCYAQAGRAQPVLETPQQVNDRIRELSATLRMMPHDYVIGSGDLLSIYVFDVEELSREVRVSQTGTIGIPLLPVRLHVAGLTEMQVEQKIAELLEANGLVTHADVSVSVKEHKSKPITVVGAVSHPMVYEADRPLTLLEVLAEAGGISSDAGDTIIVSRQSQDAVPDAGEPPEIAPEQPLPAKTSSADATTPRPSAASEDTAKDSVPAASPSASGAAAASSNPSANAEPPPLTNTITVN